MTVEIPDELWNEGAYVLAEAIELVEKVDDLLARVDAGWARLDALSGDEMTAVEWGYSLGFTPAHAVLIAIAGNISNATKSIGSIYEGKRPDELRWMFRRILDMDRAAIIESTLLELRDSA